MSLLSLIGFRGGGHGMNPEAELPVIFSFNLTENIFVSTDVRNIYTRILTDVLERTQGIPAAAVPLLWDNCVANESADGLVTMLARAMSDKSELFLVYEKALKLIRKATGPETEKIRADYKKSGDSSTGVFISFKNYMRTDMVRLYSGFEYCAVAALHKSMNLSKAIQLKINELRSSVGAVDSEQIRAQGIAIATGLSKGLDVMLDAKDTLESAKPDLTAANAAMEFIAQKQSFYLGLPATYITGLSSKGLGDSGKGDTKSVERGLKNYFFSVVKPAIEAIFGGTCSFKSENFDQVGSALEALKTFELTSDEYLSSESKRILTNQLFGLPEDTKGDAPKSVTPQAGAVPTPAAPATVPA